MPRHDDGVRSHAIETYRDTDTPIDAILEEAKVARSTFYTWLREAGITRARHSQPTASMTADELRQLFFSELSEVRAALEANRRNASLLEAKSELLTEMRDRMRTSQEQDWPLVLSAVEQFQRDIEQLKAAEDEFRRFTEQIWRMAADMNATLSRLVGAVETLVTVTGRQPDDSPD